MMYTPGRFIGRERLIDLERTVDSLNGQLRKMQWDLYRVKAEPLPIRLWRNLVIVKGGQELISDVCKRFARTNKKMRYHSDPRA